MQWKTDRLFNKGAGAIDVHMPNNKEEDVKKKEKKEKKIEKRKNMDLYLTPNRKSNKN